MSSKSSILYPKPLKTIQRKTISIDQLDLNLNTRKTMLNELHALRMSSHNWISNEENLTHQNL
jgi:hypothetical protein